MKIRVLVALTVAVVSLGFAAIASATTNNYWGFNYMNNSTPSACSGWGSGHACTGWNNWDYTQVQRNGGDYGVGMGFIYDNNPGQINYAPLPYASGTYTKIWNDGVYSNPTHYNRVACLAWEAGSTYMQCRALIS